MFELLLTIATNNIPGVFNECDGMFDYFAEANYSSNDRLCEAINKIWHEYTFQMNTRLFKEFKAALIAAQPNNSYLLKSISSIADVRNCYYAIQLSDTKLAIITNNANLLEADSFIKKSFLVFDTAGANNIISIIKQLIIYLTDERGNAQFILNNQFPNPQFLLDSNREGSLHYTSIQNSLKSKIMSCHSLEDKLLKISLGIANKYMREHPLDPLDKDAFMLGMANTDLNMETAAMREAIDLVTRSLGN